jgi:hypothetical protein
VHARGHAGGTRTSSGYSGVHLPLIPQVCNPSDHGINIDNMDIERLIIPIVLILFFLLPLTDLLVVSLRVY